MPIGPIQPPVCSGSRLWLRTVYFILLWGVFSLMCDQWLPSTDNWKVKEFSEQEHTARHPSIFWIVKISQEVSHSAVCPLCFVLKPLCFPSACSCSLSHSPHYIFIITPACQWRGALWRAKTKRNVAYFCLTDKKTNTNHLVFTRLENGMMHIFYFQLLTFYW